jgi:hypothetical protein
MFEAERNGQGRLKSLRALDQGLVRSPRAQKNVGAVGVC